jgi:hypothetical protein
VQHILRYLKGTLDYALVLGGKASSTRGTSAGSGGSITREQRLTLEGYTDADWGNEEAKRRSTSGYAFFMAGSLVSWSSKRQHTPAVSSTEAEYMALARATKEALWLQRLVGELQGITPGTIPLHVDNSSCIALAKNPEAHDRTKHIDIQYHFLRAHIATKRVKLVQCPTALMVADVPTKAVGGPKHHWCVKALGLRSGVEESKDP